MADYKRLIIDLAPDLYDELERSATDRGIDITELLRRAIALDKYLWDNRDVELQIESDEQLWEAVATVLGLTGQSALPTGSPDRHS